MQITHIILQCSVQSHYSCTGTDDTRGNMQVSWWLFDELDEWVRLLTTVLVVPHKILSLILSLLKATEIFMSMVFTLEQMTFRLKSDCKKKKNVKNNSIFNVNRQWKVDLCLWPSPLWLDSLSCYSRILILSTFLQSLCRSRSIIFIENVNVIWGPASLLITDVFYPNMHDHLLLSNS